ncbi:MAG TPA: PfkB family carbohydrate kinase [Spirochaetia bacterium]|nr:PfkB family carbohydrate kinase [Spirochaetia bacterium]
MNEPQGVVPNIEEILSAIPRVKIGVVGDFCLDFYQFVDMSDSEISVETGLETLPVREVRYSLGGAGNVVNNLSALGARGVRCFGVVGNDPHGELLARLLRETGADPSGVLVQSDAWLTQTYTKVMVGEHENPRIDWGNYNRLAPEIEGQLVSRLRASAAGLDLLIINQQLLHGIHTPVLREALAAISGGGSLLCISDSRDFGDEYKGSIRKLNDNEGIRLCGSGEPQPEDDGSGLDRIVEHLWRRWRSPVLLTRGERGCLVRDKSGFLEIPGIVISGPIDTVGAGDSMLAGTAAALAAGKGLHEAAGLGNLVAAITVKKLHQTGTATPDEIRELARTAVYRFHPEIAAMPSRARYHGDSRIEVVTSVPSGRRFTHVIFDNDGTLSTLRQGWEEVMEPMMVKAILGDAADTVGESAYLEVVSRVREYIDRTTGVQTLIQMHGLVELVRELGYVPSAAILDPKGYKEIFNRELMLQVNQRIRQLESGELEPKDFLVKGAVEFVTALVERGVVAHLASGTDHDDVKREAESLGFAALFGEAIHGSVGDIENDPKKRVIETILNQIGRQAGPEILTFGDGPVEIRETQSRGGYAVGVASNELRRFGLNPAKRKRLIEAGADLVVSDFTQRERLLALLFGDK